MRVHLESTTRVVEFQTPDGVVPARIWEGVTDSCIRVVAYITRIAVDREEDTAQFVRELQECRPPLPDVAVILTRLVL